MLARSEWTSIGQIADPVRVVLSACASHGRRCPEGSPARVRKTGTSSLRVKVQTGAFSFSTGCVSKDNRISIQSVRTQRRITGICRIGTIMQPDETCRINIPVSGANSRKLVQNILKIGLQFSDCNVIITLHLFGRNSI